MVRLLSAFFPFLIVCCAYAQTTGADAPADKASMLSVVLFLLLFVGTCVGYFAYIWWREKKKGQRAKGEKTR